MHQERAHCQEENQEENLEENLEKNFAFLVRSSRCEFWYLELPVRQAD